MFAGRLTRTSIVTEMTRRGMGISKASAHVLLFIIWTFSQRKYVKGVWLFVGKEWRLERLRFDDLRHCRGTDFVRHKEIDTSQAAAAHWGVSLPDMHTVATTVCDVYSIAAVAWLRQITWGLGVFSSGIAH